MLVYVLQIACFILFAVMVYLAKRRGELWFILVATIYAAFFENLDIILAHGQSGSYFYDPRLILLVVETPIFIILSWGVIFYSAYTIARGLCSRLFARVLTVPLIILLLDLALDPVAARLGLWTWVGYGPSDGILGVPITNFVGWYLVMLGFMLSLLLVPHMKFLGRASKYIIIPPFSFVVFILLFSLYGFVASALNISKGSEVYFFLWFLFFITIIPLILWFVLPAKHKIRREDYTLALGARIFFYIFGFSGLFLYGLWQEPIFIITLVFTAALEFLINIKFRLNATT
ncbi:carotenoid biosynthesis protein [Patescibacteria group bacterium]|nr:carotenoid biosynthesis protein [Patescibacteria group bacterium]MBU1922019.1 carotenoid biosynthesis protein [Patescibacteria group bacterium]